MKYLIIAALCLTCVHSTNADVGAGLMIDSHKRRSWLHWWETNQADYLPSRQQAAVIPHDQPRVIEALTTSTHNDDPRIRAAAAWALGRMGATDSLPRLVELTADPSYQVRYTVWAAIGLLDGPDAEKALLAAQTTTDLNHFGVMTGLGLLSKPSEAAWKAIHDSAIQEGQPWSAKAALWAIRVHARREELPTVRDVFHNAHEPLLSAEAALTLGTIGDNNDLDMLWKLANVPRHGRGSVPNAEELRTHARIALLNSADASSTPNDLMLLQQDVLSNGAADSLASYTSGLLLLTRCTQGDLVTRFLTLSGYQTPGSSTPKPGAVTRGFCAIAMGLYGANGLAPLAPPQRAGRVMVPPPRGQQAHAEPQATKQALLARLADESDDPMVRSACAVALALQKDRSVAPELVKVVEHLERKDGMVFAHVALALAMLKDDNALPLIQKFLGPGIERIKPETILKSSLNDTVSREMLRRSRTEVGDLDTVVMRRTLALAIGLTGDARAAPMLRELWGKDQWSSLEAARAMSECGVRDPADAFLELATQKDHPAVAELALLSLGELLDNDRRPRIDWLTTHNTYDGVRMSLAGDNNYKITVVGTRDIANPFLYNFLEPLVFYNVGG
jgi:HEAT repeat protein